MSTNKQKIKIGYIVRSLDYGGVEKYVVDLVNNLDDTLFCSVIFCLTEKGELAKKIKNNRIKVYELHKKKGNDFLISIRLGKLLQLEQIDIIHSNNWSTFVESVLAKLYARKNIKLMYTQHGMEMNDFESKAKRFFRNRLRQCLFFFLDQCIAVSLATKKFINKEWIVPEKDVRLIYNGVDFSELKVDSNKKNKLRLSFGIKENEIVIGSVGRLMKVKNYPLLIKAVSLLYQKNKKVKLLFVGNGPEKNHLNAIAEQMKLENNIIFAGQRDDVTELLSIMDIFVLPSISEGISLALLEAMAAGLPVIATSVGGNKEIIQDGINGLLVESDNEKELFKAMQLIISEKKINEQIRKNGLLRVKSIFSLDRMVKDYQIIYLKMFSNSYKE